MNKRYDGQRDGHTVMVRVIGETLPNHLLRHPLRHIVRHSPTGFGWGESGGSAGAADLARSILVDALEADALCSVCDGKGTCEGDDVCLSCDHGIREDLPYQDFRASVVAKLPREFMLMAEDVREWHRRYLLVLASESRL